MDQVVLGVSGYRNFNDYTVFKEQVEEWIKNHQKPDKIIVGDCKGADRMAARYADEYNIPKEILKPDRKRYPTGNTAFAMRDREIAKACTHMLAFPSVNGKGTQITIEFAKKFGKRVTIFNV